MAKTARLDLLIVELGLLPSRQVAQTAIMDGGVLVNGNKVTKPGSAVKPDANIELVGNWRDTKFVSRGGYKLERALQQFQVDPTGRICLDLGASTGGFTDCLLKHGADKVYAIDVGYGQLDWSLQQNPRVVVKDRTNARNLKPDDLYGDNDRRASLAVADLSFISLTKVLPAALTLLEPNESEIVALIKPQFEAGKEAVGKGGVIRSKTTHEAVLRDVAQFAAGELQLQLLALTYSPIKGPAGNIEFLAHWRNHGEAPALDFKSVVAEAHHALAKKESPEEPSS
jgi:23S rRNA (cytidine1920-2'-O)/16S rRNA (cytidine1409-2'-O)-methyltransferase